MDFGNKEFVLPNVPDLTSMMSKVELPHIDPIKYEDTFFKEQADDVVKQISAQYGPQIEALRINKLFPPGPEKDSCYNYFPIWGRNGRVKSTR